MHIRPRIRYKRKTGIASLRFFRQAVLFLTLSLTGCAGGSSGGGDDLPHTFETQFHSPEGGVEDFTVFGDSVYYSTFDGEFFRWTPGGEAEKMDMEPFMTKGNRTLRADHEGNLYVFYSRTNAAYLVKYDSTGKELAREDISELVDGFIPRETATDGEGNLYLKGTDSLFQFDGECICTGEAKIPENERLSWLAGDDKGHVYCGLFNNLTRRGLIREVARAGETSAGNGNTVPKDSQGVSLKDMQSADPDNIRTASSEGAGNISFGSILCEFQPGNYLAVYGENRFLTSMDNALYLYDMTAQTRTALLQWANCDINPDSVQRFAILSDGRIVVRLREEEGAGELAVLTEVSEEQASQKEVITLGILQAGNSHLLRCVSRFNRNSPDCRIEIREYYDALLNSDRPEAEEEARTALHLDISSDRCPDILILEYDDIEIYASKGLLEDLTPYIEENGQLKFSDNVLKCYTFGGKLCALPGSLQIRTIAGRSENLGPFGDGNGRTTEEMMDFIDSCSSKTALSADAGQFLQYCLTFDRSRFVDPESHTCDFTSDEFISLLEFCGRFSDGKESEGNDVLNLMGKGNSALLHEVELARPEDISLLMQVLGTDDISYVGFPTADGRPGSLLEDCGGTCAISVKSEHKEKAWAFMELLLTGWDSPPKSFAALLGTKGFPTELNTREQYFAKVTENPYHIQENGEILVYGGKPVRTFTHALRQNGQEAYFYVPLPEETDLICELLDSSMTARGGSRISAIVSEEAEFYFSGQKSAADVAAIIQNRVSMYLKEQE